MQPKEVVKAWVETFNGGDADKLAGFYAEDAINHQVANQPVIGRPAIRDMFKREFTNARMVRSVCMRVTDVRATRRDPFPGRRQLSQFWEF